MNGDLELIWIKKNGIVQYFGDIVTVWGRAVSEYDQEISRQFSWVSLSVSAAQQGRQVIYSDHGGLQHQQGEEEERSRHQPVQPDH